MGGVPRDDSVAPGQAVPVKLLPQSIAAISFFKNERSWLDGVWFVFPPQSDNLIPAPYDTLGIFDRLLPAPSDLFGISFGGVQDAYSFTPLYNAQYQHAGVPYADAPIGPADGASTLNGIPTEGNP